MKAKPMGMLWMIPAGWPDRTPRAARWAHERLPQGRLGGRTRKFTLLGDAMQGIEGAAAIRWGGETDRERQFSMVHHLGGERRHLFGAGEGPAEAVAEAKQESMGAKRKQFVKKFVSEQWILSCKSLGHPLVYHL